MCLLKSIFSVYLWCTLPISRHIMQSPKGHRRNLDMSGFADLPDRDFWIGEREAAIVRRSLRRARAKKSKPFGFADGNNGNGASAKPIAFFFRRAQTRSKRSRFITLFQAPTKSWTNFPCASELA